MTGLTAERFAEFFRAVNNDHDPFPWQQRLVDHLFATGGVWPRLLDLPTASGKTSTVDIALYTLAAGLPVPRRIVFVVDRRVIVQQAASHAKDIREALRTPKTPILQEVRTALFALHGTGGAADDDHAGTSHPFELAELRGAIEQNRAWAARPDIPAIIASTVDQVGSRLLYRGYGVSDRMRPVHAGLIGNDALILLDEVHLARPFADLLGTIRDRFRPTDPAIPDRWQVAELSATPKAAVTDDHRFQLGAEDLAHSVLGRRLHVPKPARLVSIQLPSAPDRQLGVLAAEHAAQALSLVERPGVRTIAVIVNRVPLAVDITRRLNEKLKNKDEGDPVLLVTGRMRGLDRDRRLEVLNERTRSGADLTKRTTIVVATQTIEAGADLDFDAIVTDCASIDALIQRFGRVDRIGALENRLDGAERPESVIIGSSRLTAADDPVYGSALGQTWEWLTSRESLDFGPVKIATLRASGAFSPELSVEAPRSMRLLRSHLDRLVRTAPIPDGDVDVDRLLHGLEHEPDQEVEVVWRADVTRSMLYRPGEDHQRDTRANPAITALVETLPAVPGEAMSVPLVHVRNWLNTSPDVRGEHRFELSDIESPRATVPLARGWIRPCVLVRGPDTKITTSGHEIRPGDTIIVPADYGGVQDGTWAPRSIEPVEDLCDLAAHADGLLRVRLNPAVISVADSAESETDHTSSEQLYARRQAQLLVPERPDAKGRELIPTPGWVSDRDIHAIDALETFLMTDWVPIAPSDDSVHKDARKNWVAAIRTAIPKEAGRVRSTRRRQAAIVPIHEVTSAFRSELDDREAITVYAVTWPPPKHSASATTGHSSYQGGEYPLVAHLEDVERWAGAIADAVGVKGILADDLLAAARLHDLGKADPRFQLFLREGFIAGTDAELLAKSQMPMNARSRNALAREKSGYPRGLRHEVASVALIPGESLVTRYLTASHHGLGRPFFPAQVSEPITITIEGRLHHAMSDDPYGNATVGGGSAENFAAAVTRFGYFGVGWVEALLRLADHAASNEAQLTTPQDQRTGTS